MVERGVDAVVAEANLRFRSAARYDDVVELRARVEELGREHHHADRRLPRR